MSDIQNTNCNGDCSSCGDDCNLDFSNPNATVTLTLDDDTELECAVLTIFPAGQKKYIALLPLDENGENQAQRRQVRWDAAGLRQLIDALCTFVHPVNRIKGYEHAQ